MENIEKSKFEFVQRDEKIFDKPPETKPVGFYKDAWRRFKKNKASVVAACIIIALVLFSLVVPLFSRYNTDFHEGYYKNMLPKNFLSSAVVEKSYGKLVYEKEFGIGVAAADISVVGKTPAEAVYGSMAQGIENEYSVVKSELKIQQSSGMADKYIWKSDTYKAVGFIYDDVSMEEYQKMKEWQQKTGKPLLYPMIDRHYNANTKLYAMEDANIWYMVDSNGYAIDSSGNRKTLSQAYVPNYYTLNGKISDYEPRVFGEDNRAGVRLLAENWFLYKYGTTPKFAFGTNISGQDLLVRVAKALQTSLLLGVAVTVICFLIGGVLGAYQGYYGGTLDMIVERFKEVWSGIPFMAVLVLIQFHWISMGKITPFVGLLIAFIAWGWMGDSSLVRSQFYRFKGQEYVLATRTLGAKDTRVMFRHIFPNSLGTIITSLALAVPSIIFTETTVSYLGIIKFTETPSIGDMLSVGQEAMTKFPHVLLWPALVIALLMISFNLFGNGLRDAFNPQLRGAEE